MRLIPATLRRCTREGCRKRSLRLLAYCPEHAGDAALPCEDCRYESVHDNLDRLVGHRLLEPCSTHASENREG